MRNILLVAVFSFLSALLGVFTYSQYFEKPTQTIVYEVGGKEHSIHLAGRYAEDNRLQPVDFTAAASKSTTAVVHISTTQRTKATPGDSQSKIYEYFDKYYNNSNAQKMNSGSGVLISSDGYIVTNNHVVQDGKSLRVTLYNKKTYQAKLVGRDANTDLAVLKINGIDLPFVEFANSDEVKVGEWVLAVGNPFNLASTVTAGIISAKGRDIDILDEQNAIESFLQTDAAVNEGNSGGALVSIDGELVGINTAIATREGGFSGYSFAVPSNIVYKTVNDLKKFNKVQRASLGIMVKNIDNRLANTYNLKSLLGVYVTEVITNGSARRAGIQRKDVITAIDGVKIGHVSKYNERMSQYSPGETIEVTFVRNGEEKTARVLLRNENNQMEIVKDAQIEVENKLGARFEDLSLSDLKDENLLYGVRMFELNDGVLKFMTSIREGFILHKVNNKEMKSAKDIYDIFSKISKGSMVKIEGSYSRDPMTRTLQFAMP